jgi:hypothetical protein
MIQSVNVVHQTGLAMHEQVKACYLNHKRSVEVVAFIEDMEPLRDDHSGAEGVGVDSQGNVYGAVVRRQMLERHVLKEI